MIPSPVRGMSERKATVRDLRRDRIDYGHLSSTRHIKKVVIHIVTYCTKYLCRVVSEAIALILTLVKKNSKKGLLSNTGSGMMRLTGERKQGARPATSRGGDF